jgi:hypothetical protein
MEVLINRKISLAYEGAEPIAKAAARSCVVGRERSSTVMGYRSPVGSDFLPKLNFFVAHIYSKNF